MVAYKYVGHQRDLRAGYRLYENEEIPDSTFRAPIHRESKLKTAYVGNIRAVCDSKSAIRAMAICRNVATVSSLYMIAFKYSNLF